MSAHMRSPIDAFVAGALDEDQLVHEVDRVLETGDSGEMATLLVSLKKYGTLLPDETLHKIKKKVEVRPTSENDRRSVNVGDVLNRRFVLKEKLGFGGMGTVFKALDLRRQEAEDRNPYVALKVIKAEAIDHPEAVKILQREARKTQRLAHPNVVMVYDYDRDGDLSYITMELLEGETLDKVLAKRRNAPLPVSISSDIIEQIASALDAAHAIGLVHLDLKPANIFIERNGHVKIIDFGIAKILPKRNSADATVFDVRKLGALTPAYASIEMLLGEDVDARDDVFGFCCIAYEVITGKHPFNRKPATVAFACNLKPARPGGLTDPQWRALLSGLDFDKSRRLITAKQVAASLCSRGAYTRNVATKATALQPPAGSRRGRLVLWGGLGAALAGVALLGMVLARSDADVWRLLPFSAGATGGATADRQRAEAARAEAARKAAVTAQQADAERKAAEQAQQTEAAREAAEEAQRADAARKAEEAQRAEAARTAAEAAQQADAARKAAEQAQQAEDARKVQAALRRARGAIRARPDGDRSREAVRAAPDQELPRESARSRADEEHPRAEDLDRLEQGNGEESARLREEEDARIQREIAEREARSREAARARQGAERAQGDAGPQPDGQ